MLYDSRDALFHFDSRVEHAYVQMGMARIEIDRVCSSRFRFSRRIRDPIGTREQRRLPLRYRVITLGQWVLDLMIGLRCALPLLPANPSSTTRLDPGGVIADQVFAVPARDSYRLRIKFYYYIAVAPEREFSFVVQISTCLPSPLKRDSRSVVVVCARDSREFVGEKFRSSQRRARGNVRAREDQTREEIRVELIS